LHHGHVKWHAWCRHDTFQDVPAYLSGLGTREVNGQGRQGVSHADAFCCRIGKIDQHTAALNVTARRRVTRGRVACDTLPSPIPCIALARAGRARVGMCVGSKEANTVIMNA